MVPIRRSIAEDGRTLADAAHHGVHAPVAVEIPKRRSAMPGGALKIAAGLPADIDELSRARICEDQVRLS